MNLYIDDIYKIEYKLDYEDDTAGVMFCKQVFSVGSISNIC